MRVTIIYGSESELLTKFIEQRDGQIIRIYNKKVPLAQSNCHDIQFDENLKNNIDQVFQNKLSSASEIIFIGAAFVSSNELFISEGEESLQMGIDTNILNYVNLTKILLSHMIKIKNGCFIYLSSFRSTIPTRGAIIYSASKAFGESFFKGIGMEYGRFNISSHIIRMGYFDGRILHALGEDKLAQFKRRASLNRLGNANDLIGAIDFCERNKFSNSGIVEINGGLDFL